MIVGTKCFCGNNLIMSYCLKVVTNLMTRLRHHIMVLSVRKPSECNRFLKKQNYPKCQ